MNEWMNKISLSSPLRLLESSDFVHRITAEHAGTMFMIFLLFLRFMVGAGIYRNNPPVLLSVTQYIFLPGVPIPS